MIKDLTHKQALDYLQKIDDLVQSDFCFSMVGKDTSFGNKYTQIEAKKMAKIIGEVYKNSHVMHCKSCRK